MATALINTHDYEDKLISSGCLRVAFSVAKPLGMCVVFLEGCSKQAIVD